MVSMTDKKTLRKEFLKHRRELSPEARKEADGTILRGTEALNVYRTASIVTGYVTDGSEPDVLPLLVKALADGKKVCLPKWNGAEYVMVSVTETDINRLVPGKWGLLEPLGTEPVDLVGNGGVLYLVPGVAFDDSFGRLGRGGGIYDRLLSDRGSAAAVGIFYECQRCPCLPSEEHDVTLDIIVTESAVRKRAEGHAGNSSGMGKGVK